MMTIAEKRKIVQDYIQQNPECTYLDIKRATKIKIERIYTSLRYAYESAGVQLSKNLTKRHKEKQRDDVLAFIKENGRCTVTEIQNRTGVCIPRVFGSILTAYREAGVPYPKKEVTSGVQNPFVVKRCRLYERQVIQTLAHLGQVTSHVRTTAGIVDCLLTYNNETFVVEIKDFRARNNITMSQLKQLLQYMRALKITKGLMICPKESFPVRKNNKDIHIENNHIRILSLEDIQALIEVHKRSGDAGI